MTFSKPPFPIRKPGSGPLHPAEAAAQVQMTRPQAQRPSSAVVRQVSTPASSSSTGVAVALPLRLVNGAVTLAAADSANDGYLLSDDWATFSAKEPALGSPAIDGFALVSTAAGVRTWVRASLQAHAIATKTTTYAVTSADEILLLDATGGAFTATLPTAAGITGRAYTIKRINSGANAVTVATTSAQTIDGAATFTLSAQWQFLRVVSDGANWLSI